MVYNTFNSLLNVGSHYVELVRVFIFLLYMHL
jgi:hypothetical protein